MWNYRGYGRSHKSRCLAGQPSPENIREDADCLLAYLREVMGLRGKLGVYGRSMGGIATCHLASKVDMVIVDRSFADLEKVIEKKLHGMAAVTLYSLVTPKWDSGNVNGFLKDSGLELS